MKEYIYYVISIFTLLFSLICFYQRDFCAVQLHLDDYVIINAEISEIYKSIFLSETKILYYIDDKPYYDKVCYDSNDKVNENIKVYYNTESLKVRRKGFVKTIDIYSVLIIIIFTILIGTIIAGNFFKVGTDEKPLLVISLVFDIYLWYGTYSALLKNDIWRFCVMLVVWGIGMLTLYKLTHKNIS